MAKKAREENDLTSYLRLPWSLATNKMEIFARVRRLSVSVGVCVCVSDLK